MSLAYVPLYSRNGWAAQSAENLAPPAAAKNGNGRLTTRAGNSSLEAEGYDNPF